MRRPVPNPASPGAGLRGLNPLPTPAFSGRAGGCRGLSPLPGPPEPSGASVPAGLEQEERWKQRGRAGSARASSQGAAPVLGLVRMLWRQEVGGWEMTDQRC